MEHLPLELIEKILSTSILTIQDVISFSSTCNRFRHLILNSFVVWKHKFYEQWPQLVDSCSKNDMNYFEEIRYIYELKIKTLAILETMPSRFYKKYQLSDTDFEEWAELIYEKDLTYHYLVLHLMKIVNTNELIKSIEVVPLNTPGNKTLQYFASKVLRFMRQLHLSKMWTSYINLPLKEQILEKGATLVAQWCQPEVEITEETIASELDFISNLVRQRLFSINPNHELFKASEGDSALWRNENLDKNQWNVEECRQLIVVMGDVIYSELRFCGNNEDYYIPENSFINKVLETRKGLPIILAIIYESVGRRLGLIFEPINFPTHFLLRFIEDSQKNGTSYYIDTFNGGNVMQKGSCPYSNPLSHVLFPVASAQQVIERIANNLELSTRQHIEPNGRVTHIRSILELLMLVNPQDLSAVVSLAKVYTLHKINTKTLEDYLTSQVFNTPEQAQNILTMLRGFSRHNIESELDLHKQDSVHLRTSDLKFAVGMIMTDITHNDKCLIYGWNPGCPAGSEYPGTAHWPTYSLVSRPKQPFYNVLVEDGSYRYVSQDTLIPSFEIGTFHLNKDVGRHFSHFFENHFVPNTEKEKEYPFDSRIRHKFYHEIQLTHYKP